MNAVGIECGRALDGVEGGDASAGAGADVDEASALAKGGGDLLTDVAEPLPVAVIAEMLGIPESDRAPLRPWSADICGMYELSPSEDTAARAVRASNEFSSYLRELIAAGLDARPIDELSIEVICAAGDDEAALDDIVARAEQLIESVGAAFIPIKHGGVIYIRPPIG